jgi:hypothetical protein
VEIQIKCHRLDCCTGFKRWFPACSKTWPNFPQVLTLLQDLIKSSNFLTRNKLSETDIGLVANCPESAQTPLFEGEVFDYVSVGTSDIPLPLYLFKGTPIATTPLLKGSVDTTRGSTLSLCFNQLSVVTTANWTEIDDIATLDRQYYDLYASTPGKLGGIRLNIT